MTDPTNEDAFLGAVDHTRALIMEIVHKGIEKDPDAYPFVLEMLNAVLHAGIEANTIGGSEPEALRAIGHAIKQSIADHDPASIKFITVV